MGLRGAEAAAAVLDPRIQVLTFGVSAGDFPRQTPSTGWLFDATPSVFDYHQQ